jgi:uncharacterized protein
MLTGISAADMEARIARDNAWWDGGADAVREADFPRRVYFRSFKRLALNPSVPRATVLLGPRRVGKTFMIKQLIHEAIKDGQAGRSVVYASIDAPIYSGVSLERLVQLGRSASGQAPKLVIFDEIQYLPDWEVHLKDLVDNHQETKFVASGSAAAALRLKSRESGAGRFSDFMLPPLTFFEFLKFRGDHDRLIRRHEGGGFVTDDIVGLNAAFIDYLNFGGYPEAVLNQEIQRNAEQFIRNDIIDKVLLKDLPSLYGINDIQELNRLFSVLAYNAGHEASLERISQQSGITKPTIRKYIEYLESAFLVIKLSTVDENCRSMSRERNFKIYLNNPSMRAALFSPIGPEDGQRIGHLAECAVFAQWQHLPDFKQLKYARWRDGEVDAAFLDAATQKPRWIAEIKWSDRPARARHNETKSIRHFLERHDTIEAAFITTRTSTGEETAAGRRVTFIPTAIYCYIVGQNIAARLDTFTASVLADRSTREGGAPL